MSDIQFSRETMSSKVWLFRHIPLLRRLGSLKDAPSVISENRQMRRAFDRYCDGDIPPVLNSEARSVFKVAFAKFNWQQHRQKRLWQKFIIFVGQLQNIINRFSDIFPGIPSIIERSDCIFPKSLFHTPIVDIALDTAAFFTKQCVIESLIWHMIKCFSDFLSGFLNFQHNA